MLPRRLARALTSDVHSERRPAADVARLSVGAVSRAELVAVALAITVLVALPYLVPELRILLLRPLWLDELHTWLLSREVPGPVLVDRLGRGADFNPPLLYLLDWAMLRLLPDVPTQMALRTTSVLPIGLAAVLLHLVSRNRVGPVAAMVGSVAMLSHPVLLGQLYEARFYAVWLLLVVGVALAMQRLVEHPDSWRRFAALAPLSALTCLIHYFGVISLACLAGGALLQRRSRRQATRLLGAIALGVLALVAWLPVYARQRHVFSVTTWVPPVTLNQFTEFMNAYYAWPPLALMLVAVAVWATTIDRSAADDPVDLSTAQAALFGAMALPIVLVVFSLVVQPALIDRYALPAVAGLACVAAVAVARLPVRLQQLVLLGAIVVQGRAVVHRARGARAFDAGVRARVLAANSVADDPRPVITTLRNVLYPVALSAANRNSRLAYLAMPTDSIRRYLPTQEYAAMVDELIVERDAAAAHRRIFGFPALMPLDSLRRLDSFFVLSYDRDRLSLGFLFGDDQVCRIRPHLFLVSATPRPRGTIPTPVPECGADDRPPIPRS